jgi:hypothetical protein
MKNIVLGCIALIGISVCGCSKSEDTTKPAPAATTAAPAPTETAKTAQPTATASATATAASGGNAIPDIPEAKSNPPTVAEWGSASEINTVGANSAPKNCFMKIVREWLKVNCSGKIERVDEKDGLGKQDVDHFESIKPGASADYVIRLRKGVSVKAKIIRADDAASLFVNWPGGAPKPATIALQAAPR